MKKLKKAKHTFKFYTRLNLTELTGVKANNIEELLNIIKTAHGSCIYHHSHRFLQQHQYLSPEPPNDFAYWITEYLGEAELGEAVASIDTIQYDSMKALQDKIVNTIEKYIKENPHITRKFAKKGSEFHFIKSVSFIVPTPYEVHTLKDFAAVLEKVTVNSIYFHMFESRLRLEKGGNDFSRWIEDSLEDKELAWAISRVDPYTQTLESLRVHLINMIKERML
ncbi:DUF5752 family protein [bacterium]